MQLVTLDFETYYARDYGLKALTTEAYIRDPRFQIIGVATKVEGEPAVWASFETEQEYADHLAFLSSHMVLAHNAAFDGAILNWRLGIKPRFWFDTLSMARPKHGLAHPLSLDSLTTLYGLGKKGDDTKWAIGMRREHFEPWQLDAYGRYCCNDTELTYRLFRKLGRGFPADELRIIDIMLRMFTEPVLELDADLLTNNLVRLRERRESLIAKVTPIVGDLSLASNPQFADLLRKLGVEPPMKTSPATGKQTYALSKKDVEFKALAEHPNDQVQAVVAARLGTKSTQEETRTGSFLGIASRGNLPVALSYYAAHTGRPGGFDKQNLTNLPSRDKAKLTLRRSIVAPPGHVLISCDSSQIEARVVAYLAGQDDLVEAFRRGADIYSDFATDIYGYPVDRKHELIGDDGKPYKPHFTEGNMGKCSILGLGFGMGGPKFKNTAKTDYGIDTTDDFAAGVVALYRQKYPKIKTLWDENHAALERMIRGLPSEVGTLGLRFEQDRVYLPNGLYLSYPNLRAAPGKWPDGRPKTDFVYDRLRGKNLIPQFVYGGKNTENCVQALARIVVFEQMIQIAERYKVALQVYDENLACVREDQADEAAAFMLEAMSQPPKWAPDLPIAAEVSIGRNYADCK